MSNGSGREFWEKAFLASWQLAGTNPNPVTRKSNSPDALRQAAMEWNAFAVEISSNCADLMLEEWRKRFGPSSHLGERPEQADAQQPSTESPNKEEQ